MSERERREADTPRSDGADGNGKGDHPQGPNLTLVYSLIALALVAAIAIAAMIVLPFYQRR
jgi:hypothetical protein